MPWLLLLSTLRRSRRFIRSWRPDVVHAWLFWAHLWGWLTAPRGIPLITSRRQTRSDKKDSPVLQALENRINKRAVRVIANSRRVAHHCLRREKHLVGKLRVVYNGIQLDSFEKGAPADLRREFPALANAEMIAVTVANLLPHKGYFTLLDAWAEVCRHHPRAKILCIGTDGGIYRALERQLEAAGLENNVVFAGLRTDVPALLKRADFAVHASHDEGFSNAVLEYMAAGLAVAATHVGGNQEALRMENKSGLLVPPGDAKSLASAIERLIEDGDLRRELGQNGARRARHSFTLEKLVEKHILIYRHVMRNTTI